MEPKDKQETQRFALFNILVGHCGEQLTPDKVDAIMEEIIKEMRSGPCSWAFE